MKLMRRQKFVWDTAAHKAALERDETFAVKIITNRIKSGIDPDNILGYKWLNHLIDPLLKGECEWQKETIIPNPRENVLPVKEKRCCGTDPTNHVSCVKAPVLIRRGESNGRTENEAKDSETDHKTSKRGSERPGLW